MKAYPFSYAVDVSDEHNDAPVVNFKPNDLNAFVFKNDAEFDLLYPEYLQLLSLKHWTPLTVAREAAEFLAVPDARVLDIGSGIGKFCLAAGHHFPETFFYGVEQRHELICLAEEAKAYINLPNVNFVFGNVTQINFKEFDHFYFYNSFHENIDQENQIDDTIELSESLYAYYHQYLYNELNNKPLGTRLVTFHSLEQEVPPGYKVVRTSQNGLLKMWVKAV